MTNIERQRQEEFHYLRRMLLGFLMLLLIMVVIFLIAGRLTYWQGWVYAASSIVLMLISAAMFRNKTDLIKERVKPGPGTKWWDKIFFALYVPGYVALFMIASLDAGRFRWSPQLPVYVYIMGYAVYVLSISLVLWAMWTNRFFSSRVRIQTDRGQVVVQDGPYRFVRHPGYSGGILLPLATALILGSLWALVPAGFIALILLIRTHLEDITLQKELAGYSEYTRKVRYRLLPRIW